MAKVKNNKDKMVGIRLTNIEALTLQLKSAKENITMSDYIRNKIIEQIMRSKTKNVYHFNGDSNSKDEYLSLKEMKRNKELRRLLTFLSKKK